MTKGTAPLLALVLFVVAASGCGDAEHSASMSVPGSRDSIRIVLKSTHPFLAEYDRSLRIERDGQLTQAEVPLFPDTGGYARVNVYEQDAVLVLRTAGPDEYLLERSTGRLSTRSLEAGTSKAVASEATFVGAFDFDDQGTFAFIPASQSPERKLGPP